jgi:hypothetical protein
VDGRSARLVPADQVAMGVAVGPGAREVELWMDRRAIYAGLLVSLLAWLGLAWLARRDRQ